MSQKYLSDYIPNDSSSIKQSDDESEHSNFDNIDSVPEVIEQAL